MTCWSQISTRPGDVRLPGVSGEGVGAEVASVALGLPWSRGLRGQSVPSPPHPGCPGCICVSHRSPPRFGSGHRGLRALGEGHHVPGSHLSGHRQAGRLQPVRDSHLPHRARYGDPRRAGRVGVGNDGGGSGCTAQHAPPRHRFSPRVFPSGRTRRSTQRPRSGLRTVPEAPASPCMTTRCSSAGPTWVVTAMAPWPIETGLGLMVQVPHRVRVDSLVRRRAVSFFFPPLGGGQLTPTWQAGRGCSRRRACGRHRSPPAPR